MPMGSNSKPITRKEMEEQNEIVELTNYAQEQLMLAKKKDLPKYIKKRKRQFLKELKEYNIAHPVNDDEIQILNKTLPLVEITDKCFEPFIKNYGIAPQYSASELAVIFDYFKDVIKEMNKEQIFPPTKEQFCQLCGFSTSRFTEYRNGSSPEIREIMLQVEDYIANYLNIGGLTRRTDTVTGIFIQKSSLGRKEATEPQQVVNNNNLVLSDSEFAELLNKYSTK